MKNPEKPGAIVRLDQAEQRRVEVLEMFAGITANETEVRELLRKAVQNIVSEEVAHVAKHGL